MSSNKSLQLIKTKFNDSGSKGKHDLPDAFPKCFMSLNPIVTAMQRIMSIQLISGI